MPPDRIAGTSQRVRRDARSVQGSAARCVFPVAARSRSERERGTLPGSASAARCPGARARHAARERERGTLPGSASRAVRRPGKIVARSSCATAPAVF
ncbi:hypothetical protein [Xanthomonas phage AhaSv]|nr:hypothetical protein [Xanthomonas phage AhaSv]